nr:unnamed protein product [Digitaria exilis]
MPSTSCLKRAREGQPASPPPPMASRRREVKSPPPVPTKSEAMRFVKAVEREFRFAGKPGKYKEFLSILYEFKHGRLGIAGVIERMQVVLQGHPYVIGWFNKFVPRFYELNKDL